MLVQDYQLSLVPAFLRRRRPDLRIVHFTHTPFCGPDAIRVLPDDVAAQLCESLAGGPSGFHTDRWASSFHASARAALGPGAEIVAPFAASLGPDPDALAAIADEPAARAAASALADRVGERLVILRTDRMEPSKNIVTRVRWPSIASSKRGRDCAGASSSSRCCTRRARRCRSISPMPMRSCRPFARVNDRWATRDWTPIVLDTRDDFARSVAGMQRYDVLFVNPVKDGLNLVAKEGPILNRRDGLVCLSREAGAYDGAEGGRACRCIRSTSNRWQARSTMPSRCHSTSGPDAPNSCETSRPRAPRATGSPTSSRTHSPPGPGCLPQARRDRVEQHDETVGAVDNDIDRVEQRRRRFG